MKNWHFWKYLDRSWAVGRFLPNGVKKDDMKQKLLKLVLICLGGPRISRDSCDYCPFRPGLP